MMSTKTAPKTTIPMLCSVEELGCDRHDFPEAPEYGIYIFPEPVELGKDIVEVLDLKDEVVEYEITSNRPDCFSVLGIAREAAATYDIPFHYPEIKVAEKAEGKAIARVNDMVVFVPFVAPGDVVDIQLTRKKNSYAEGKPSSRQRE